MRLQARHDRREALDLGAQRGVALELRLEGGALVGRELAEQVAGDAVAHRADSSSSMSSRSRASACTMRILTVPERDAGLRGDLALAAPAVEAAAQHVRLLRGQPAEQVGHPPLLDERVEAGLRIGLALEQGERAGGIARLGHAPAQLVDRPGARDGHQPGERRAAAGVVGRAALPGLEEDLLEDVLRGRPVAERAHEEAQDRARRTPRAGARWRRGRGGAGRR